MPIALDHIDSFTSEAFSGNPAAVCLLEDDPRKDDAQWQQALAAEMNLSETAFVWNDGIRRVLRFFSPTTEISFCGHATLATMHCLWSRGIVPADQPIECSTYAGKTIACSRSADGCIEMRVERPEIVAVSASSAQALPPAIAAIPDRKGMARSGECWLVELHSEQAVMNFEPDLASIGRLPVGLWITARSDSPDDDAPDSDYVARCFFPAQGIPEDPVTGSAHCALGPYWAEKLDKKRLVGQQRSARGGEVYVHVGSEFVRLAGYAITLIRGEYFA